MRDHEPAVRRFFQAYQELMNDGLKDPPMVDGQRTARAFARYFVGSDPKTVAGGRNGLLFRLAAPRGYAFYRKIGTQRMEVRGLEIEALDDFHVLARTHWWSSYRCRSGERLEIEFDNIYLLHIAEGEEPKIFAYITGDEKAVLKQHGLI